MLEIALVGLVEQHQEETTTSVAVGVVTVTAHLVSRRRVVLAVAVFGFLTLEKALVVVAVQVRLIQDKVAAELLLIALLKLEEMVHLE